MTERKKKSSVVPFGAGVAVATLPNANLEEKTRLESTKETSPSFPVRTLLQKKANKLV